MNREDIIRMAREACDTDKVDAWHNGFWTLTQEEIERFAALVAAAERTAMMQLFTDPENQPTQHGTVTVEYMQREVAAEREACAKVLDEMADYMESEMEPSETIAWIRSKAAIRARGENT